MIQGLGGPWSRLEGQPLLESPPGLSVIPAPPVSTETGDPSPETPVPAFRGGWSPIDEVQKVLGDANPVSPGRRRGSLSSASARSWDTFLLIVAGMKLLRASFCHPGRQFAPLGFAVLFFHFDCRGLSESFLLDFFLVSILFSKASPRPSLHSASKVHF